MDHANVKSDFIALLKDEGFVRLVQSSEDPDQLLQQLICENRHNAQAIRYAFEFIHISQTGKQTMHVADSGRILKDIENHLKKWTPSARHRNFRSTWLRVAAIALIVLSIGSMVAYYQYSKDPLSQFAQSTVAKRGEAMIVLSDGSIQELKSNDSFIDYSSTEGEVIIKKDTAEEMIGNSSYGSAAVLNQVVVPFGQRHNVLLSDGTLVQLNAGSKLTFPATFTGKSREVYLEGEGFFEVHKNAKAPFIVKTGHIDIKVLGTKFNVAAYGDEQTVSTVLVEGKVNVSQKNKLFANEQFALSPGQGCFYSINNQNSAIKNVDVNDYVSWKDGIYNFKKMPLREVVGRIRKYFNRPVQIEGERLAGTLVSGKLMLTDDLEEVLRNLAKTIEGTVAKTPDGNYFLKQ